jgi:hypothetical protein
MYKVYDGQFDAEYTNDKFRPYQIKFNQPFLYSGEKNLVMAIFVYSTDLDYTVNNIQLQATASDNELMRHYPYQAYEVNTNIADSIALNKLNGYNELYRQM